jgi:hypothetical protein
MATKTDKPLSNFDERALPAFGRTSADKSRRAVYIEEARKRARLYLIQEAAENRAATDDG